MKLDPCERIAAMLPALLILLRVEVNIQQYASVLILVDDDPIVVGYQFGPVVSSAELNVVSL